MNLGRVWGGATSRWRREEEGLLAVRVPRENGPLVPYKGNG